MVAPVLPRDADQVRNPANAALLALAALSLAPLVVHVPTNLNVVLTASVCVFAGCWRSVKKEPPADSMSHNDAMRFPLIGSAVLLSLFLLFKFLPKELVNTVLTGYFVAIGVVALTATIAPLLDPAFPARLRERRHPVRKFTIPYLADEPIDLSFTVPEAAAAVLSAAFCGWYCLAKHWLANNTLGLAFSLQGIEHLSLGSVTTGAILLSGLFVYDIFWVFCTPVMVSVARSFDAPIKLLFPRAVSAAETGAKPFSMLGLGDIVIPGIFVALLLRRDALTGFRSRYFYSTYGGYVAGLAATIVVMNVFDAAQPALLYIVPAVLGALALHAAAKGEVREILAYSEAKEDKKGEEGGKKAAKEEPAEGAAAASTPPPAQQSGGSRYNTRSAKKQS